MSASSQSYTMESTPPSSSIQALKEPIKEKDGHIYHYNRRRLQ
jgi:hypothetical protein